VGSRFAVQTLNWISRGANGRIPERASQVSSGLGVVLRALATGRVTSGNPECSESDVIHDHIRLRQHQIVAITYIGVRLGARHMEQNGHESSKAVGGPSGSSQLSPGGRSAEMISYGRTNANREVLISASARTCCQRPRRGDLGGRALW
jgi:hypothetical protein